MEILSRNKLLSHFQEENTQTKKQQQLPHSLEFKFSKIFGSFYLCKSKLLVLERALWQTCWERRWEQRFFPESKIFSASNKFWLTLHMLATGRRIRLKLSIYLLIYLSIYLSIYHPHANSILTWCRCAPLPEHKECKQTQLQERWWYCPPSTLACLLRCCHHLPGLLSNCNTCGGANCWVLLDLVITLPCPICSSCLRGIQSWWQPHLLSLCGLLKMWWY